MKTGVKVGDAMTQNPVVISMERTVSFASKVMLENRVGSLLVMQGDKIKGIITEKDVVRVVAKGMSPRRIKISEVMRKKLHTTKPNEDLYEAVRHMKKNKVRRLPVVYKGKLVGLLTHTDVLKLEPIMYEMMYDWINIGISKDQMKSNIEEE